MALHPIPSKFLIYEENFVFFFISVTGHWLKRGPACESIVPEYGGPGVRLLVPVYNDDHGQGGRTHLHASNNQSQLVNILKISKK